MKIAIISDTHFGYTRFEEDAFKQAENAFLDADKKADCVIYAGDIFDTKIPKLETINKVINILKKVTKPVFAIHGNHERRSRDLINPAQLLASTGLIKMMHGTDETFEFNGEKIQVFGMGNVPEELAQDVLIRIMEKFTPKEGHFRILVLHQSIRELIPNAEEEISLDYLEELPFDLIVNGHIHERIIKLGGRFIIPGSTVITQLKKEETAPRGYVVYDTKTKTHEFVEIEHRKFFYHELKLENAGMAELRENIERLIAEDRKSDKEAIIRIKITGTLKEGVNTSDLAIKSYDNVFIDNHLNIKDLKTAVERIKSMNEQKASVKEVVLKQLAEKAKGKITRFDALEMFEKLSIGVDESMEYLEEKGKNNL